MRSKNKPAMTRAERAHVDKLAQQPCVVCEAHGVEIHEIKQGAWFLSVPLCTDCHRGSLNGIHGQRRIWAVKKMDELDALAEAIRRVYA